MKANFINRLDESKPPTRLCHTCRHFSNDYLFADKSSRIPKPCSVDSVRSQQSVSLGALATPSLRAHEILSPCLSRSRVPQIILSNPHILNTSVFTKENAFLTFPLLIIKCPVLSREQERQPKHLPQPPVERRSCALGLLARSGES